ncbi:MAG: CARDB domain-containing protein [Balneolaceae bacterium]
MNICLTHFHHLLLISFMITPGTFYGDSSEKSPLISTHVQTTDPFMTDISIAGISTPSLIRGGETVEIFVAVNNLGNQDITEEIIIELTDQTDNVEIGSKLIRDGLAQGNSTTLRFIWNTEESSLGDHTLNASHNYGDDVEDNNFLTDTVIIR